jgi:hypothetical protein
MDAASNQDSALARLRNQAQALRRLESDRDASERFSARLRGLGAGALIGGGSGVIAHRLGARPLVSGAAGALLGSTAALLAYKKTRQQQLENFMANGIRPVKSTMIHGLGRRDGNTYIRFNTNNIYKYPDITDREHTDLSIADSMGKHFNQVLRARAAERVK